MSSSADRDLALRAEGVGKRYWVHREPTATTLAEALTRRFGQATRGSRKADEFWALRDISFELRRGEALGLIGRNGAGKSTLLKIVSRITAPTTGRITSFGRVATLLEVGTGFHPELTGRENIFLNGAILGMRRQEIREKLDAIVDFSGVAAFLDEPVKHYSSGMHVRLAFSVAAHLDSDVLLVDEVLAVGDAEFQRKCMGKMRDVADTGRAVVFVSHNLNAVQRLCSRALLVDAGRLEMDGPPGAVTARYLERWGPDQTGGTAVLADDVQRFGTGDAKFRRVALADLDGRPITAVHFGQPFRVKLLVHASEAIPESAFEIGVCTADGERISTAQSIDAERPAGPLPEGLHEVEAELRMTLLPGEYSLTVGVHRRSGITLDYVEQVLGFSALNVAESGDDSYPWRGVRGYVRPDSEWTAPAPAEDDPRTATTGAHT
jgi:lipopolysaccharide transport system ATP-binding protein